MGATATSCRLERVQEPDLVDPDPGDLALTLALKIPTLSTAAPTSLGNLPTTSLLIRPANLHPFPFVLTAIWRLLFVPGSFPGNLATEGKVNVLHAG